MLGDKLWGLFVHLMARDPHYGEHLQIYQPDGNMQLLSS